MSTGAAKGLIWNCGQTSGMMRWPASSRTSLPIWAFWLTWVQKMCSALSTITTAALSCSPLRWPSRPSWRSVETRTGFRPMLRTVGHLCNSGSSGPVEEYQADLKKKGNSNGTIFQLIIDITRAKLHALHNNRSGRLLVLLTDENIWLLTVVSHMKPIILWELNIKVQKNHNN